jgi:ABC-2 type transport system permease protein
MTTSESAVGKIQSRRKIRLPSLPGWLRNNPIIIKEMQSRMRGWRSIVGLTGFTLLLSVIVSLIYFSFSSIGRGARADTFQQLGRAIFFTVYGIELFIVCIVSPALTAGAISIEKEQQTYDLLRTTLLSARALVIGKLVSAISFVVLFLLAALPIQSIGFIFGGLTIGEVIVGILILILTSLAFGALGILFSSFISKTRVATAVSQVASLIFVAVIPGMTLIAILSLEDSININRMSDLFQILFFGILWLIGITSPAVTAIVTEVFIAEEQALYFMTGQLNSGATIYVPSPWLGFVILYPLITMLLIYLTIRIVQRTER